MTSCSISSNKSETTSSPPGNAFAADCVLTSASPPPQPVEGGLRTREMWEALADEQTKNVNLQVDLAKGHSSNDIPIEAAESVGSGNWKSR